MTVLTVMALSCHTPLWGSHISSPKTNEDNITISLITCYPGSEIYELCGHSAVRVRGNGIDSVWNYGIFDFNQPNFVYRFVKGETDYRGASYPFRWFLPEYQQTGRKVVEQDLNLTPEEARKMHELLKTSVLPENAVYRYNYIKDNCSTRILNVIDSSSKIKIVYPDTIRYGTFRDEMRSFHKGYPWYQFGIDVALGSGLDENIGNREEMFVPIVLMENIGNSHFSDGRPLVKATRVLNPGREDAVLPPTPWYVSPLFWSWIVALIMACIVTHDIITRRITYAAYIVWFLILGLAGCLVAFLVFISVHEASSPNILIFWLNPVQLLFAMALGIRKFRLISQVMSYYNILATLILLVSYPFYRQSFNPAFFPLILFTLALAASYAIISNKISYKRI